MAKKGPRLPVRVNLTTDEVNRLIDEARAEGVNDGRKELQIKINNWLQEKYLDREVEKGSPKGEAILQIARELNIALNEDTL